MPRALAALNIKYDDFEIDDYEIYENEFTDGKTRIP